MTTPGARRRLTGHLTVALPAAQAYRLFTARGEQDWAQGWSPQFPAPTVDDTEPGTVFRTHAHGSTTTWIVIDSTDGRRISYARTIPDVSAGTVTVALEETAGHSDVTVTYELTALSDEAQLHLAEFAEQYPAFLRGWEDAITALLAGSRHG